MADPLLDSLVRGLQVLRDGTGPLAAGVPLRFHVEPRALDLKIPTTIDGQLNLTFLTKSVRFADALFAAEALPKYLADIGNVLGGLPVVDFEVPLPGPPLKGAIPPTSQVNVAATISTVSGTVTPPPITPPPVSPPAVTTQVGALEALPTLAPATATRDNVLSGVPGLLGQLTGSIPMLVESPVSITVSWRLLQDGTEVTPGLDTFEFLGPVDAPDVEIVLSPQLLFEELTTAPSGVRHFSLIARVTISAGTATSQSVDLPAIPIVLPAIPVPTIAILFQFRDYAGQTMVFVPANSPVDTVNPVSHVTTLLSALRAVLAPMAGRVGELGFFLGDIANYFAGSQGTVVIQKADQISNTQTVQLRGWNFLLDGLNTEGMRAEDVFESLILIGRPSRALQCFNARQFDPIQGQLNVITGRELLVKIRDLSSGRQDSIGSLTTVVSEPGLLTTVVVTQPAGSRHPEPHPIRTFFREISSLRFA